MKISVIGGGPVGLVTAGGMALFGYDVVCVEKDAGRLSCLLEGHLPFYEPDLKELIRTQCDNKRLKFCRSIETCTMDNSLVFICVDSPILPAGRLDASGVYDAVLGFVSKCRPSAVVVRSTVPVGTAKLLQQKLQHLRGSCSAPTVVYNPEFMREGRAVEDFLSPSRVIIGTENSHAAKILRDVYEVGLPKETPVMVTDSASAELIKLASNAFIAMELSFVNELSDLCGSLRIQGSEVVRGMSLDPRVGIGELSPGPGWGGPCLAKDASELVAFAAERNLQFKLIESAIESNARRIDVIAERIATILDDICTSRIALLGLTFKANTSDLRNSPALAIAERLIAMGAEISAFDPTVGNSDSIGIHRLRLADSPYDAARETDCLLVLTEWDEFADLNIERVAKSMRGRTIVDLRARLDRKSIENLGLRYFGLGNLGLDT
ncbi:MAG: UDP-glucose/GDP-mannose dehydrogenase family protein [Candidatus Zixiibacteriota bacterium]|nr:MAG: UDP-glucose/GDP-mannose dehydrogenase family protein [candidate division Zixibacteria bacterium]